jgi:UDP:flavonoid glycosyltransferase YjiC (YdhE family)
LFWDQYDNAQRVAEIGHGVRLGTYAFADDELRSSIDGLLADSALRNRTAAVGRRIRAETGSHVAADLIERVGRA